MSEVNSKAAPAAIEPALPAQQQAAIDLLLKGLSIKEAADVCGVTRQTVHRWLRQSPAFQAVYNQWHSEMKENVRSRLLILADKAAAAVEKALESGDAKSGLQLLKGIGLLAPTPNRPTEEPVVRKAMELDSLEQKMGQEKREFALKLEVGAAKSAADMWEGEAKRG